MGKNILRALCLTVALMIGALAFAGCGQKTLTLEEMVAQNPDMGKEISKGLGDISVKGVSPKLSYKKNTIIISLVYDKTFKEKDVKIMTKAFEKNDDAFDDVCTKAIANIKKSTDLQTVKIKIQVLDGEGTELWKKTYGKSD